MTVGVWSSSLLEFSSHHIIELRDGDAIDEFQGCALNHPAYRGAEVSQMILEAGRRVEMVQDGDLFGAASGGEQGLCARSNDADPTVGGG